jgi:hypothetical protein
MPNFIKYSENAHRKQDNIKHPGVKSLLMHDFREYKNPSNKNIKPELSHLNYSLTPARTSSEAYARYKARLNDKTIKRMQRKDIKTLIGMCVSIPDNLPLEFHRDFFVCVREFMLERYGRENEISAVVHYDENKPHMDYTFTPITEHNGQKKFRASEVINREELFSFHRDLSNHLTTTNPAYRIHFGQSEGRKHKHHKDFNKHKKQEQQRQHIKFQKGVFITHER